MPSCFCNRESAPDPSDMLTALPHRPPSCKGDAMRQGMGPEGRKMRVRRGRDVRKGANAPTLKYDLPLKKKLFYKVSVDNFLPHIL